MLARVVSEVQAEVQRGPARPSVRTKFQVVALLVREERARIRADEASSDAHRAQQLKRLDGVATILARTAALDTSLLALIGEDAKVSASAKQLRREMLESAGVELIPEVEPEPTPDGSSARQGARWCRSRSSPASWPIPSSLPISKPLARSRSVPGGWLRWELLGPLLRSFEVAGSGATSCMACPSRRRRACLRACS